MSETWKIFANLTTTYAADLQGHLNLAGPLSHLAAEVSRTAQTVVQQVQNVSIMHMAVHTISVLLKVT